MASGRMEFHSRTIMQHANFAFVIPNDVETESHPRIEPVEQPVINKTEETKKNRYSGSFSGHCGRTRENGDSITQSITHESDDCSTQSVQGADAQSGRIGNAENDKNLIAITALTEDSGMRLDAFIGSNTDELSRSYAVKLIEKGKITVNGEVIRSKKHAVASGDEVVIDLPEPEILDVRAEDIPLEIVYEDGDVLVVNKPRGMVVHPGSGNWSGTLVNAVMHHCGNSLSTINGVIRPGIVHRIDKDTSGLLMIAKNDRAHESLAEQLRVHSVTREYTALCLDNIPEEDAITINAPIGRDERNRMRRAVYGSGSRDAVTHITVLERYGRYTLVKARLETGRTHQIRVHMAYIHHPLAGDELYGPRNASDKVAGIKVTGQLLHAGTLGFVHPATGKYMEFHSELPEVFQAVLLKLRGADHN